MRILTNLRWRLPEPLGFSNQSHGFFAFSRVQSINENDAVEVVGLMLHASRKKVTALNDHRFTVHVHSSGYDATGPSGVKRQTGK